MTKPFNNPAPKPRNPWAWIPTLYFAEGIPYVVAMTVAVIIGGLLPILLGSGTGSEIMSRIAAPMVGGMVTAPLLSMLVVPAAWYLLRRRRFRDGRVTASQPASEAA